MHDFLADPFLLLAKKKYCIGPADSRRNILNKEFYHVTRRVIIFCTRIERLCLYFEHTMSSNQRWRGRSLVYGASPKLAFCPPVLGRSLFMWARVSQGNLRTSSNHAYVGRKPTFLPTARSHYGEQKLFQEPRASKALTLEKISSSFRK